MQSSQMMTQPSDLVLASASQVEKPTPGDWAILAIFIPFSIWVLWTSWRWREERKAYPHHRSLD